MIQSKYIFICVDGWMDGCVCVSVKAYASSKKTITMNLLEKTPYDDIRMCKNIPPLYFHQNRAKLKIHLN